MIRTHIVQILDPNFSANMQIYTSLEGENPGGSIKDHMVMFELDSLLKSGRLKKGDRISEVSSGSTALSLAHYGQKLNLICHLFIPNTTAHERVQTLQDLGAIVHLEERAGIYEAHEKFCQREGSYFFNQLWDEHKKVYYQHLGKEFTHVADFDIVIGAVGTGHSLKGVGMVFPKAQLTSVEPKPGETCNGVRNIEYERYGASDPCLPKDFKQRIILQRSDFFSSYEVKTNKGIISFGDSFRMVLGGIQKLTQPHSSSLRVLALGADNKFLQRSSYAK